jgi:hypothetical protein
MTAYRNSLCVLEPVGPNISCLRLNVSHSMEGEEEQRKVEKYKFEPGKGKYR